jgi:predicted nucleic acid-binding protein
VISVVILDTDFLSAFLKVQRLPLIRTFFGVETVAIPPAVYREIAVTDLLPDLLDLSWIEVQNPRESQIRALIKDEELSQLGRGEQEAIALAQEHRGSVLLMNDNRARRLAARQGVHVVNIPAFLLACKMAHLLDREATAHLIADLKNKDRYGFRGDVLRLLLS